MGVGGQVSKSITGDLEAGYFPASVFGVPEEMCSF